MPSNKPYRRTRNLFDPHSTASYKLSRSRLENFINCPRCFYLDRRLGIEPPAIPSFTLNSAVDSLLKKEFDIYRQKGRPHPLMQACSIDAVPFAHPLIDEWRENFKGVQYHHKPTNLIISGAVDDIWVNKKEELFVVDYKSTSTQEPITLESPYRQAYKRQMEIYQWLLRNQGFKISNTGYFLYCNASKAKDAFDGKLEFELQIIPYEGQDSWVDSVVRQAWQCLMQEAIPESSSGCEYCAYRRGAKAEEEKPKTASFENVQGELFSW